MTLHVALKRVFELVTTESVLAKIRLADQAMRPLTGGLPPRIAVSALNPHAGEDGLFGDEEQRIISPAVELGRREGIDVAGPFPNDTLFHHALAGSYDAVVAMYHDQGHIALKTAGFERAVNVTLGLPIVRTSVAHGTAFDIAWKGLADPSSLIAAVRVAARLVAGQRRTWPALPMETSFMNTIDYIYRFDPENPASTAPPPDAEAARNARGRQSRVRELDGKLPNEYFFQGEPATWCIATARKSV